MSTISNALGAIPGRFFYAKIYDKMIVQTEAEMACG